MTIIKYIYRIFSNTTTDEFAFLNCNEIAVGDEGCIFLCLDSNITKWGKLCIKLNKEMRFLTPIVPDKYIDELYQQIQLLAEETSFKVTFNDYGLLYRCKNLIDDGKIVPVLGRILTRSMIDCNWTEKLLEHERETKKYLTEYSLMDDEKKNFLEEYKIREVEVNYHVDKISGLRKKIKLPIIIYDNYLLSVGRVCFSAKYQGMKLPECVKNPKCAKKLDFLLKKKWSKRSMSYETPENEFMDYMSGLYMKGNIVYRHQDMVQGLGMNFVDAMITDNL